jgi:hypothetical protein
VRRCFGLVGVSLLAVLVLASCGTDDGDQTAPPQSTDQQIDDDTGSDDESDIGSNTDNDVETPSQAAEDSVVDEAETLFPDVVGVDARLDGDGTWTFNVTLSSPYDSAARYADAWRVVGPGGEVYGERILLHDHAGEQPFTRSQSGIAIPEDVDEVAVEGRDQVSGWGGQSMTVTLERG